MKQEDYRTCMSEGLKGKTGLSKEERQLLFCTQSQLCSGKAATKAEAEQICINQPPKEPKLRKSRGGKCVIDPKMVSCIASNLEIEKLTVDNLPARLEVAITHCTVGNGSSKPLTYKRFMNSCMKESATGGDFIHSQKEIKACQAKWNEMRGDA